MLGGTCWFWYSTPLLFYDMTTERLTGNCINKIYCINTRLNKNWSNGQHRLQHSLYLILAVACQGQTVIYFEKAIYLFILTARLYFSCKELRFHKLCGNLYNQLGKIPLIDFQNLVQFLFWLTLVFFMQLSLMLLFVFKNRCIRQTDFTGTPSTPSPRQRYSKTKRGNSI